MFTCDTPESAFISMLNLISVPGDVEVSCVPNMAEVKFGHHQAVAGSPFFSMKYWFKLLCLQTLV